MNANDTKDGEFQMAKQAPSILDAITHVQSAVEQTSTATTPGTVSQTLNVGRRPGNAGKKYPATPPSPEDVKAILDVLHHPDQKMSRKLGLLGLRNRALVVVLWRAGLRIHEALLLKPDDIDFEHGVLTVRRGKGGKRRIVGIDPHALSEINAWLHVRALLGLGLDEPVFCVIEGDQRGAPLNQSYARLKLHDAARRAGVLSRTAPHQLRHALAVELARAGIPVPLISRQLGHSNVATTATYLSGIAPEEVIEVMSARSW